MGISTAVDQLSRGMGYTCERVSVACESFCVSHRLRADANTIFLAMHLAVHPYKQLYFNVVEGFALLLLVGYSDALLRSVFGLCSSRGVRAHRRARDCVCRFDRVQLDLQQSEQPREVVRWAV